MIEFVYNWFIKQPFTVQLSIGWLASCLLILGITMSIYNPLILAILILVGLSMTAIVRILLYYMIDV